MFFMFASDFVYRIKSYWFPIPRETYVKKTSKDLKIICKHHLANMMI